MHEPVGGSTPTIHFRLDLQPVKEYKSCAQTPAAWPNCTPHPARSDSYQRQAAPALPTALDGKRLAQCVHDLCIVHA